MLTKARLTASWSVGGIVGSTHLPSFLSSRAMWRGSASRLTLTLPWLGLVFQELASPPMRPEEFHGMEVASVTTMFHHVNPPFGQDPGNGRSCWSSKRKFRERQSCNVTETSSTNVVLKAAGIGIPKSFLVSTWLRHSIVTKVILLKFPWTLELWPIPTRSIMIHHDPWWYQILHANAAAASFTHFLQVSSHCESEIWRLLLQTSPRILWLDFGASPWIP